MQGLGAQLILRSFPQGAIIVFDADLRFVYAGGRGLADIGLSSAMLEGNTATEVFPPEVADRIVPLYRAALAGQESEMDVEYRGRIFVQRLGPLLDTSGAIVAGIGFTQDVTAARQAQRDLREESRRLRDAESIGRVGSWELDLRDQAVTWSPGIFKLYGLDQDEFEGDYSAALHIIDPEDQPHVNAAIADCASNGTPVHFRYRITLGRRSAALARVPRRGAISGRPPHPHRRCHRRHHRPCTRRRAGPNRAGVPRGGHPGFAGHRFRPTT